MNDIEILIAAARTKMLLAELEKRHPEQDWRTDPPCPDCGSMAHFECDRSMPISYDTP